MEFCKEHMQYYGGPKGECLLCVRDERDELKAENKRLRFEEVLPPHAGGLQLGHNPHKASYETVERYEQGIEYFDWISEEERKAAIETDSIWVLQWYPKTPIGFLCIAASSLEAIIKYLESNPE